jgi:hypothetical protein
MTNIQPTNLFKEEVYIPEFQLIFLGNFGRLFVLFLDGFKLFFLLWM